ncbi:hypothetical protein LCGC14_2200830 [marine sediment metagenome]|uniref:Uncharacterized protein n=1 Tax=marine sediment metagenome TaxID=412755 RepID=A0A0F9GCK7_9ZZZZ
MAHACQSEFNEDSDEEFINNHIGSDDDDTEEDDDDEYSIGDEEGDDSDDDEEEEDDSEKKIQSKKTRKSDPKINWNTSYITFKITGSLNDFAENPEKTKDFISEYAKGIFESGKGTKSGQQDIESGKGTKSGQDIESKTESREQETRSENHMLVGLSLIKIDSDFPCTLALNITGVDIPDENKTFTSSGICASYIIPPKMKHDSVDGIQLNEKSRDIENRFLQSYPGRHLGNISEGIIHLSKDASLVRYNHPVIALFNRARTSQNKPPLNLDDLSVRDHYQATRKDTDKCLSVLKKEMQKHLKIQDLYKMGVTIDRAFTKKSPINGINQAFTAKKNKSKWLDDTEIYEGITNANAKTRISQEVHNLYVTLKAEFTNVGK